MVDMVYKRGKVLVRRGFLADNMYHVEKSTEATCTYDTSHVVHKSCGCWHV